MSEKLPSHRLPANVRPVHYEIHLEVDLDNFTYNGIEKIFIDVIEPTRFVTLNSIAIKIKTISWKNDKATLQAQNIEENKSEERVSVRFEKEIAAGKNSCLTFEFEGSINENLNGFYRSRYVSDGQTKYAAVTQFAPTDARRCFPCWDEPALKATFNISLTFPRHLVAVSNMPIECSSCSRKDWTTTHFQKTPLMSTYLVAFIICDYGFINKNQNDKVISVYVPKENINLGEYSLEVAAKALSFYESYFSIPYPLSKLDLISVADFSYGAMENWGMITYREAILLVDLQNSSTEKKQKCALTVAHELAHQWFGNLVTMEWWTHLWLNEGFASFMQYLCIDLLYPQFNIWTQFITNQFIRGLALDALNNTHPIEVPVENPSEINEIFDEISYNKGASVIRMIHDYMGDEDFRRGMNLYIDRYKFSNVQTEDLWKALEEVSKKPISRIMSTWTKFDGFPIVAITEKPTKSNTRIFILSQERFFINGSIDKTNVTWMIPITLSSALNPGKPFKTIILNEKSLEIELEEIPKNVWIKLNVSTVGFFRTLHSSDLLNLLLPAVREKTLPAFDRFGLLDDIFATVQAGQTKTADYLNILKELKDEDDFSVWYSILNNLKKISHILSRSETTTRNFKIFGRKLLSGIHAKLGWIPKENESQLDTLLRVLVLSQLVSFEEENVLNEARRIFDENVTQLSVIPADFRNFIYRAVLSTGDYETYEKMLDLYKKTDMHEERNRILSSLGATKDDKILQNILEFSMSDEVRVQDKFRPIHSVTGSYKGQLLVWDYFKNHWEEFFDKFQSGCLLITLISTVTERIISEDILKDIKHFFETHTISGVDRTVQQSIETIKLNLDWLNRDLGSIKEFLNCD